MSAERIVGLVMVILVLALMFTRPASETTFCLRMIVLLYGLVLIFGDKK